jgi:amino acid transporter
MTKLKRTLGLPALTFYGVGLILGAGIYSIIGEAAGPAGESLWISFLIAGAIALLTGLSYAELATMYAEAGAEFIYMRHAFPRAPWLSRIVGIVLVCAGVAMASTVSIAFAGYSSAFISVPIGLIAAALLGLMTVLNVLGIQQSSWANIAMTLVEAAGLVAVIWIGATQRDFGEAFMVPQDFGFIAAAGLIFFAYLGFEEIANLAEEARDPHRNIPRALFISLFVSTALYVLVALAVVALLPPEKLADSQRPLAEAVESAAPRISTALGSIALFATANTALIALIGTSRMVLAIAREGDLPRVFATISGARHTPWIAALAILPAALALLPLENLADLGGIASLGALTAFAGVNIALIRLRFSEPARDRPFRVPLAIGRCPVPPVIALFGSVGLALVLPKAAHLTIGALVAVVAAFEIVRAILGRWRSA